MLREKKGVQLNEAFGAVLMIVLVAILIIVAIYLFSSITVSFKGTSTGTVINETGMVNANGTQLTNTSYGSAGICGFGSATITQVVNTTDGEIIPASNYTLTSSYKLINNSWQQYDTAKISYTYTWGGEACDAAISSNNSFSDYPTLIGLVGTIVFLGLIIGVLVASLVFGGRKEA